MTLALFRRVLLENRDIDPVALELEALEKASNRPTNLDREKTVVSAMNGEMLFGA